VGEDAQEPHAVGAQPAVQLQAEHHVRQLGLRVELGAAVVLLAVQVLEVDAAALVQAGADGDHAAVLALRQLVQQQPGQREVGEVVHAELQLVALHGRAPRRHHHARVVHQHVHLGHAGREGADRVEVGEIQLPHLDPGVRVVGEHVVPCGRPLGRITGGHDHLGVEAGECPGGLETESAVRAGDHEDASGLARKVLRDPAGGRWSVSVG
jgi:hypothetical protein